MTTAEPIARALVHELEFVPLEDTDLEASRLMGREQYAFVGVRKYWGSMVSCGLLPLAHEDDQEASRRATEFYDFSTGLKAYADRIGLPVVGTKLGSFGLLVIIAEGPTTEAFRTLVTAQKRGSAWRKDYRVTWLVDESAREIFRHRGFPRRVYPEADFFRRLLKS